MYNNNAHISEVIQYLENSYLSSSEDRKQLENISKNYLLDIIINLSNNINSVATNLNTYVSLQTDAIKSLENQVELINNRLYLLKENNLIEKFNEFRSEQLIRTNLNMENNANYSNNNNNEDRGQTSVFIILSIKFIYNN